MKKLLIGNEALARGFYEGGIGVVSSYPGTPSTEITEYLSTYRDIYSEWAPNEKVAAEVAFGASLGGKRSVCAMKHVGLNVAADPVFTMSYTGVNAGMVLCTADDPAMHSSQNEQDSRHYAIAAKLPMLEPADSGEAYAMAKASFALSEQFDTLFMIRMTTRIAHSQSIVEIGEREEVADKEYKKQPEKYIMMPAYAKRKHPVVEDRLQALTAYAESCPFNRVEDGSDHSLGIITSGTCYQYVKEVFGDTVPVLKLGMVHPLPPQMIRDFAAKVDRLVVVEELDGIIESFVQSLNIPVEGKNLFSPIGEYSQSIVARAFGLEATPALTPVESVPGRPPMMCAGCPHRGIYYILAKHKITVIGDIGCYTLGAQPPLSAVDSVLCMGASVSGLHGFNKARGAEAEKKSVAVIGDSTFMHSGITGLVDIAYNQSNSTVIILDNSITGMTGHQQNPTTGMDIHGDPSGKIDLEALCHAIGIRRVAVVDPYDLAECERVLKEELAAEEPSVIISRRPCVLLKSVKKLPSLRVDADACRGCKACMGLGCPAISFRDKKAIIDTTLCVGCGVCRQKCAFGAIV